MSQLTEFQQLFDFIFRLGLVFTTLGSIVIASVTIDSGCICGQAINSCDVYNLSISEPHFARCDLHSSVYQSFLLSDTPQWVTAGIKTLISNTINEAQAGNLSGFVAASMSCDNGGGQIWASGCSVNAGGFLAGYLSLGYHPFDNKSGTYLTQVLAQVVPRNVYDFSCASTQPYITVTFINDSLPYDLNGFDRGAVADKVQEAGVVPSLRTDNDLLNNGIDTNCDFKDGNHHLHINCGVIDSGHQIYDDFWQECFASYPSVSDAGSAMRDQERHALKWSWLIFIILQVLYMIL